MAERIGTLGDRLGNRLVRHFPGPTLCLDTPRPIISFSFDDVFASALTMGAAILEEEGARGTFYIAGSFIKGGAAPGMIDAAGCAQLAVREHELGCHSYAHRKLSTYSRAGLAEDLAANRLLLQSFNRDRPPRHFAAPFGMMSRPMQPLLRQRFVAARGILPGINRGRTDPHNLAAVELRPEPAFLARAEGLLAEALQNPGWLIFFTHDVSPEPGPYGCPPERLRRLIRIASDGGAAILTVGAAAQRLGIETGGGTGA